MADGDRELRELGGTAEAGRALRSHGESWEAAIAVGIDVTLIIRNLERAPHERIRAHDAHSRFRERTQARCVAPEVRAALAKARLREKLDALGPDAAWPEELRSGH